MAAGDTTNPSRVRIEPNERLDLVDQDRLSQSSRVFDDAAARAMLFQPRATAALPVGLVLTGGTLVANPTAPSDGKIRVPTDLCVAIDADGRYIVKTAGTAIDVSVPAGGAQYQAYLYWLEIPADQAKRRAIPVSSPYTEFTIAPNTSLRSNAGVYLRLGGSGSVVPADVVNGITTNLCLLGIVSNTAGVITISSQTANRLSTVAPPTTLPISSTDSGTVRTLHDLAGAGLYELARAKYQEPGVLSGAAANVIVGAGSGQRRISGLAGITSSVFNTLIKISGAAVAGNNGYFRVTNVVNATTLDVYNPNGVTGDANNGTIVWSVVNHVLPVVAAAPSAANNYGAYVEPRRGLDVVDRSTFAVTIGDGVATFGALDKTQFATDAELLQAAFNVAASFGGGQIVLKDGVTLTISSSFTINYAKPFLITSTGSGVLTIATAATVTFSGAGDVGFSHLTFNVSGQAFKFETGISTSFVSCNFVQSVGAGTSAAIFLDSVSPIKQFSMSDCFWNITADAPDSPGSQIVLDATVGTSTPSISIERTTFKFVGNARTLINIDVNGNQTAIRITDCSFIKVTVGPAGYAVQPIFVSIRSFGVFGDAIISNCQFIGGITGAPSDFIGVNLFNSNNVVVSNCLFSYLAAGVRVQGAAGPDFNVQRVHVYDSRFTNDGSTTIGEGVELSGNIFTDFLVSNCNFSNNLGVQLSGGAGLVELTVTGCQFFSSTNGLAVPAITGNIATGDVHLIWTNNRHFGYNDLAVQDRAFGFSVQGQKVRAVISNNKFNKIQNGAYVGAGTGNCDLIRIVSTIQSWTVTGNVVSESGNTTGGAARNLMFLHATSSGAGWDLETGTITGNTVGDAFSKMAFVNVETPVFKSLVISGNNFYSAYPGASADYLLTITLSTAAGSGSLMVNNNNFGVSTGTTSWFFIGNGATTLTSCTFSGNSLVRANATGSSSLIGTVISLMFSGNIAAILGDSVTSPVMTLTVTGAPTNFNANGNGTFPASAAAFPSNININRV